MGYDGPSRFNKYGCLRLVYYYPRMLSRRSVFQGAYGQISLELSKLASSILDVSVMNIRKRLQRLCYWRKSAILKTGQHSVHC